MEIRRNNLREDPYVTQIKTFFSVFDFKLFSSAHFIISAEKDMTRLPLPSILEDLLKFAKK